MPNAQTQYQLEVADIALVLAIARAGTLPATASRLGVDTSTVFRSLARIEKSLGQRLFERTRSGYCATDLALGLMQHAERIEIELEAARAASNARRDTIDGTVRITSTDTLLYGLLMPTLGALVDAHPLLQLELSATNELANLTKRDADIALRATKRPPDHLVGRHLGPIRAAVFGPRARRGAKRREIDLSAAPWIAPDDALPDHPSVLWRRRHQPKAAVRLKVNSILAVMAGVTQGLGVGILPLFMTQARTDVLQLTEALDECETQLWLLTHSESRHLHRVSTVVAFLTRTIRLD